MKKTLVTDLDGTLLSNGVLPEYNKKAILKLKENGHNVIIATGRPYPAVLNVLDDDILDNCYLVLLNGAIILDNNKKIISQEIIPKNFIVDIYNVLRKYTKCIALQSNNKTYCIEELFFSAADYKKHTLDSVHDMTEDTSLISVMLKGHPIDEIEEIKNIINRDFGNICIAYRNVEYIDIVPKNSSKGNAILKVCDMLHIKTDDIYTIGDSYNDISMLDITDNSFSFYNCEDEIKKYAKNLVETVSECIDNYILKDDSIKKINIGIVGSSNIAHNFIQAAKSISNISLHAIYSRDINKANSIKEQYKFKQSYNDMYNMANDSELDAVYIASPNSLHFKQSMLFLKNKKHVLCEKPFSSNYNEAYDMTKEANKNNVILMEAMRPTATPNFLTVKNNLHKIGKIRKVFFNFCKYSSRYDDFKKGNVLNAFKNELSNGSIMDIGVYCIAPTINLFGMPNDIISNAYMLSTGVDGYGSTILKYDYMEAVLSYSKVSNSHIPSEIQGELGSIIIDKIVSFENIKIIYNDGTEEKLGTLQRANDIYYETKNFIDLISGNTTTVSNTLDNTLNTMKILDTIRKNIGLSYPADK